jgi:hypothetical protein
MRFFAWKGSDSLAVQPETRRGTTFDIAYVNRPGTHSVASPNIHFSLQHFTDDHIPMPVRIRSA